MKQQDKEVMSKWIYGKGIITTAPQGFYVYVATANGIVYYVGKGSKSRYTHCNSGKSGNAELNRLHFAGVKFDVLLAEDGLDEEQAFKTEQAIIKKLKPLFNNKCNNPHIGMTGTRVKGSGNNCCNWCNKKFSPFDVLGALRYDTEATGICQTCRNWKSEDDWPTEVQNELFGYTHLPNDQKPSIGQTPGDNLNFTITYNEHGKERVEEWHYVVEDGRSKLMSKIVDNAHVKRDVSC